MRAFLSFFLIICLGFQGLRAEEMPSPVLANGACEVLSKPSVKVYKQRTENYQELLKEFREIKKLPYQEPRHYELFISLCFVMATSVWMQEITFFNLMTHSNLIRFLYPPVVSAQGTSPHPMQRYVKDPDTLAMIGKKIFLSSIFLCLSLMTIGVCVLDRQENKRDRVFSFLHEKALKIPFYKGVYKEIYMVIALGKKLREEKNEKARILIKKEIKKISKEVAAQKEPEDIWEEKETDAGSPRPCSESQLFSCFAAGSSCLTSKSVGNQS